MTVSDGPQDDREISAASPAGTSSDSAPVAVASSSRKASKWPWLVGFFLVAGLLVFHLFVDFRGLSEAEGMRQAVVARELARGNGFQTQVIEPLAVLRGGESASLDAMPAGEGGPLQPLLVAALLKVIGTDFALTPKERVYFPDRLIAALSALCFVLSVAVTFLLVRRLFDSTLATATAVLLLLSELLWRYSLSGLPHMLALLWTMLAVRALVGALEAEVEGRSVIRAMIACGIFCGLLVLTLPMAICVVVGFAGYAGFVFRRRLKVPLIFSVVAIVVIAPWWIRNAAIEGGGVGAEARLRSEAGIVSENRVRSSFDANDPALMRVQPTKKFVRQIGGLLESWWSFTGGSLAALLFFPSLLHPFRSPTVAALRWALLASWLAASFGMALAGLDGDRPVDPTALHVLFLPMFTAYGLALVSVLWSRTQFAQNRFSLWQHAHLVVVVSITSLPLLVSLPGRLVVADRVGGRLIHWPPYDAYTVAKISEWTDESALLVSDLPEAVAWYGDRRVLRLPATVGAASALLAKAETANLHPAGFYLSARAIDSRWMSDIGHGEYREWASLLVRVEPSGPLAELMGSYGFRHWLNLSPSANQRVWLVCDRAYWQGQG